MKRLQPITLKKLLDIRDDMFVRTENPPTRYQDEMEMEYKMRCNVARKHKVQFYRLIEHQIRAYIKERG